MKLSTREDIEAPLQHVFDAFADVESWERAAMRHGAEVVRIEDRAALGVGMSWKLGFEYRGKPRQVVALLTEFEDPTHMAFSGTASSLNSLITLDFMQLGVKRTRVMVAAELQPRTLGARLLLQSMKLAKAKVSQRYEMRIAQICTDIEDRYRFAPRR